MAAKAPRVMAGHARRPKINKAAMATPLGGQTGDAFEWAKASNKLLRATAKYNKAKAHKLSQGCWCSRRVGGVVALAKFSSPGDVVVR